MKKNITIIVITILLTLSSVVISSEVYNNYLERQGRCIEEEYYEEIEQVEIEKDKVIDLPNYLFEGLTKFDEEGKLTYGIAKECLISEDGLTYTFTIRDDAKWSNGDKVTAYDFEYAWKKVLNPDLEGDMEVEQIQNKIGKAVGIATFIKNGDQYISGEVTMEEVGIKALDDKTFEVIANKDTELEWDFENFGEDIPKQLLLEIISYEIYFPLNQKVVESNPKWAESIETYVSNGKFVLIEKDNEKVKLKTNDFYYDNYKEETLTINLP